jgi:hypothetical protein
VLEELRLEVLRHNHTLPNRTLLLQKETTQIAESSDSGIGSSELEARTTADALANNIDNEQYPAGYGAFGSVGQFEPMNEPISEISPSSSIVQMTGWGQFDSLVGNPGLSHDDVELLTLECIDHWRFRRARHTSS